MIQFFLLLFVGINLLVRLPIRIAIRWFKVQNDKLYTADIISTLSAGFCLVGLCICALMSGEIDTELAVACIVLFGGILLFIAGCWIYVEIKERREKKK